MKSVFATVSILCFCPAFQKARVGAFFNIHPADTDFLPAWIFNYKCRSTCYSNSVYLFFCLL